MMDSDPFRTQSDVGSAVVSELRAFGFDDAHEIGRGGFGIVYRCTELGLDRTVAIKVLTDDLDENRERFLREQRAMGRLTGHPNIVSVLQVGETESGYPYLVMQYHPHGSLEARVRRLGPLPVTEVLRLGVKMAGALATAHRLGIVHRDVKPGNILLTGYGEPALSDFGIAHIAGGFKTAKGTFTGSPAFTAPEILSGDPPSRASDVYGLGATLFAALTGHAAYERRSGEQLVAQFLRIASESAPDLRESGIPDDVSDVVENAMSRDPNDRPSALALGEALKQVQSDRGLPVDDMARQAAAQSHQPETPAPSAVSVRRPIGNLPLELTSFVGRRSELSAVNDRLSESRLVTLTGIGGVGKTRLALKAAAEAAADFADGVWLVELDELRDESLLIDVLAAAIHLRDESARPLREVLIEYLSTRRLLLVIDNCEQVIDAVAKLVKTLLRACPQLRILTTSREALGVGGEAVLRLPPLAFPTADSDPTLGQLPSFDAVALFAERAAAAVPGFELAEHNTATVARICSKVDGLPLAIELAAARMGAISPEQILERLSDRYTLLTRGGRGAPTRQQTLSSSVGWSYDLCTSAEQQLWSRLTVFAQSFELQAAEDICNDDLTAEGVLDLLSGLVDKSILTRTNAGDTVRYRLLETLREFGREQIRQTDQHQQLQRRHADWYRRLVTDAAADWFSPRQLEWMKRLEREGPNIRAALEFSLSDSPQTALDIAGTMHPFGLAQGSLTETRRWLDRALAAAPPEPTAQRIRALSGVAIICAMQEDLRAATARVAEGQALLEHMADPQAHAMMSSAEGFNALVSGDFERACARFEDALTGLDDSTLRVAAMLLMGWGLEFAGEINPALVWQEQALALAESHGESISRGYALWSLGLGWWQHGKPDRAEQLLKDAVRVTRLVEDPRQAAASLEGLAWIAAEKGDPRRAAVLMAAAEALGRMAGAPAVALPHLLVFHEECELRAREALGTKQFEAACQQGRSFNLDDAIAYALGTAS